MSAFVGISALTDFGFEHHIYRTIIHPNYHEKNPPDFDIGLVQVLHLKQSFFNVKNDL